jgi:hypothetical protein
MSAITNNDYKGSGAGSGAYPKLLTYSVIHFLVS